MMRRAMQAVILVGALVLTSGCAIVDRAGAAAVVDGARFSTDQLAAEFASLDKALGKQSRPGTMEQINGAILTVWVGDQVMQKAAELEGITPDKAAIGKLRRQLELQLGGKQGLEGFAATKGIAPNMIWTVLRNSVMSGELGAKLIGGTDTDAQGQAASDYLAKLANTMHIEIAPRFGTWDKSGQAVGAAADDLSAAANPASAA